VPRQCSCERVKCSTVCVLTCGKVVILLTPCSRQFAGCHKLLPHPCGNQALHCTV
jgi:hypothetical protein